jgi:putative DNA primase/helicase
VSNASTKQLIVERADKITPRKLRWLWPERVPLGKITIFAGIPGEGKSLATVDVAARVTTRADYPDVANPLEPGEVLFIAEEDDAEDALVPRLIAAGADLSKIHIVKAVRFGGRVADGGLRLDIDVAAIEQFVSEHTDIRLMVIDPISNHLGNASMVDEQAVRGILSPLKGVAAAHDFAIVGVMHLNKKEGLSAIHRVGGAGAFIGVARASWLFARHQDQSGKRSMVPLKNNYAKQLDGLAYRIAEKPVQIEGANELIPHVEWLGQSVMEADDLMAPPKQKRTSSRTDANVFLEDFLAGGPQDATAVQAAAHTEGISERTLDRAKRELGIESRKNGSEGWKWSLPAGSAKDANDGCDEEGKSGTLGILHCCSRGG